MVPRNGYANRLQAWASSAILAAEIDASLEVCWAPEPAAAATADILFAPHLIERQFIAEQTLQAKLGIPPSLLPRYLTVDAARGLIVLAGHDLGEQVFMPELAQLLADDSRLHTLVIVAGGKFHLPHSTDFVRQRSIFYRQLSWSAEIDCAVEMELARRPQYSALHIRQTDRSQQAPPRQAVRRGLRALAASGAPRPLFVAADSPDGRDTWLRESAALGFEPWIRTRADLDRSDPRAGVNALVDWRLLSCAEALVYPRESTFSEEASVASGHHDRSLPVSASVRRQRVRAGAALARSAATYPQRHWNR